MNLVHRWLCEIGLLEWPCGHKWRPVELPSRSQRYARTCDLCDKLELLTDGELYAHFGIYPKP